MPFALSRDPLLLPLAAMVCGIVATRFARFDSFELGAAIAASLVLWALAMWKASRAAPLAGFFLVAFFGCAFSEYRRPQPRPELTAEDNQVLIVGGCVVEPDSPFGEALRFVVELEPGARVRVSLTPREGETLPPVRYGNLVEVEARVRKPQNFGNPGAFDFAGYLGRQQVYWTASARGLDKLRILPGRCGSSWQQAWFDAREWALRRVAALYGSDSYTAAMMAGMLLGDASAIERSWTDAFRRTGTYHTLVISGLHITVLAGALLTILRLCFVPLGIRLMICGAAAWAYALLAGMQIPVARSAAGFTLFLVARFFYRRGRVLNILAAVALVFLMLDPEQLTDASFQLSFLAVIAIGASAVPLMDATSAPLRSGLRRLAETRRDPTLPAKVAAFRVELRLLAETVVLWTRVPSRIALPVVGGAFQLALHACELVLISTAVQFALILPSVAYFHRLSWTSLTANTIVVPAVSAAVPLGFIGILTGSQSVASVAGWLLALSRAVVEWHASLEPAWRVPDAPVWLQLSFAASLAAAGYAVYRGRRYRAAAVIAAAGLAAIVYLHPFAVKRQSGRLEVTSIDVGQGDSHLVVTPDGKTLLVDGGGIPTFDPRFKPKLEIGEDVVSPYLWTRGLKRLDAVALTHGHDDHARGLIAILENFQPRELWTGVQPESGVWVEVLAKARSLGVRVMSRSIGGDWNWGGSSFGVLAAGSDRAGAKTPHNNDSLVLRLSYGRHSFLLTGDIERQVENELVASGALQQIDVLKVAHHGSRTSTTPGLLEQLRPAFAIISAGRYNSYRHPHADVVERLDGIHARIIRTDRDGLITFISDGRRLELQTNASQVQSGLMHPLVGE